jgi:acetyl esterase/lipase
MFRKSAVLVFVLAATSFIAPLRADDASFTRKEDVIYSRKYGSALTFDVLTPPKGANGAGVIWVISGGYFSNHDSIRPAFAKTLLDHGYTVFAVVHGSQPRYQVPEIVEDMNRAVRFIKHHAKEYGVDPERLGATGGSAGGHLSLMLGTAGHKGDPSAKDEVDRESSRVQAVACFFPPTDFLNFGETGKEYIRATDFQPPFRASFDFRELDKKTMLWERISDLDRRREISRAISPIYHISSEAPPTLIIHGDEDKLVPLQQSETFVNKLKAAGVEAKLVVKKGAAHGWPDLGNDMEQIAQWFDKHLQKQPAAKAQD